eukprot:CAMPEP_0181186386 /NCGR_PEP_ID=MMETSP1096-20121128/10005_1 /TAXON_ID=156174 ORGANISM="Chrysochromulina ericina, Strain CCMP281" /NCGR_SAMPLE_ID=MMETSP1096 /ASSEMBLY_ACC=CAM_ASM_000453 /LENGTH=711 /DNA_ID=CAMNT_0023275277 /DNA_START=238 /DNA_END=2373 /DNA_ORIENTATION=-
MTAMAVAQNATATIDAGEGRGGDGEASETAWSCGLQGRWRRRRRLWRQLHMSGTTGSHERADGHGSGGATGTAGAGRIKAAGGKHAKELGQPSPSTDGRVNAPPALRQAGPSLGPSIAERDAATEGQRPEPPAFVNFGLTLPASMRRKAGSVKYVRRCARRCGNRETRPWASRGAHAFDLMYPCTPCVLGELACSGAGFEPVSPAANDSCGAAAGGTSGTHELGRMGVSGAVGRRHAKLGAVGTPETGECGGQGRGADGVQGGGESLGTAANGGVERRAHSEVARGGDTRTANARSSGGGEHGGVRGEAALDEAEATGRGCRRVLYVRGEGMATEGVVERVVERLAAGEGSYVDVCVTAADLSASRMERLRFKKRSEAWARRHGVAMGQGVTCWAAALGTAADASRRARDTEPTDTAEWCVEREREGSDAWTITVKKVDTAARAEQAVCEAWGDFCAHALEGGRRRDERKNMREHTADEGRRGGRWRVDRQVVFLGLPSERMADETATPDADGRGAGGKSVARPRGGGTCKGDMQRGPMDDEAACRLSAAGKAMERGDEKRLFAHLTTAEEADDDGIREDRVAKVMAWYSLLEEGVDAPAGVRVRVGGSEMVQVRKKGIRRTREVGIAVDRIAMWMGTHPVVAAVDGSEKEEGGETAVAWRRWMGPAEKRGGEDTAEMRPRISGGLGGGRLPDTWDNEHAEVYAIYKTLKE